MNMAILDERTLDILDDGRLEQLDFEGLLRFHQGEATWGAAVAFRALQRAGQYLSQSVLWDRQSLKVVSAHPGPGVRDAFEYVTRCVSRNRYVLTEPEHAGQCYGGMQYAWWLEDGTRSVCVRLREGFVPEEFFVLIDRIETPREQPGDRDRLEHLKTELVGRLWAESLDALFQVSETTHPNARNVPACTS